MPHHAAPLYASNTQTTSNEIGNQPPGEALVISSPGLLGTFRFIAI